MMKKIDESRFMKSKFSNLQSKAQKVKLTDLCPEEKAKIGELIKTLQSLKTQNYQLQEQVKQLKQTIINLTLQSERTHPLLQQQLIKNTQYRNIISDLQQQIQSKIEQIQKIKHQTLKKENVNSISIGTQTIITLNFAVQTINKKKKTKNRSIQAAIIETDDFKEHSRQKIKKKHTNSTSFEKIISAKQTVFNTIWNNCEESPQDQVQQQHIDHSCQQNSKNQDEQFGQLAEKWLELKQKNMNVIRKQYQKGQIQMLKFQPSINLAKNPEISIQRNNQLLHHQQSDQQQLEDQQLNRMLKKDNFSASRFMNRRSVDSRSSSLAKSKSRQKQKPVQKSNISHAKTINVSGFQPELFDLIDQIQSEK